MFSHPVTVDFEKAFVDLDFALMSLAAHLLMLK